MSARLLILVNLGLPVLTLGSNARAADFARSAEAKLAREWGRNQPRGRVDDQSRPLAEALDQWANLKEISYEVVRNEASQRVADTMTSWCRTITLARTARVNHARAKALAQLLVSLLTRALDEPPKILPFQADLRARVARYLEWVPIPAELGSLLSQWNIFATPRPETPPDTLALLVLAKVRDFLGPTGEGFFPKR